MNPTELVLPFLDFSTISYEFSKLAGREKNEKGTDSSQRDPWKVLKLSNQVPGRFSSRGQINGERFRRDSSSAVKGKGGEILRGLQGTQG
jgi:hypothetical protein